MGGRTVTKPQIFDFPVVNRFQPTVLILEIGSNDLCIPNCNANDLATTIFHLVQQLHFDYHVDHVIVSQIMPQCSPPAVTPPYNTRVRQVNNNLYYLLKRPPFASFWCHFALLRLGNKVFMPDGVRLNQMGNHLLYLVTKRPYSATSAMNGVLALSRNACFSTDRHVHIAGI